MEAAPAGPSRPAVRRLMLGASAIGAVLSASALAGGFGTDAVRWVCACGFATSVLVFFCTLALGAGAGESAAAAAANRVSSLQRELETLRTAHAVLVRERDRLRGERDAALGGATGVGAHDVPANFHRFINDPGAARSSGLDAVPEFHTFINDPGAAAVRVAGLEAEVLAARGRAEAAEAVARRLEGALREMQRVHDADIAGIRAQASRGGAPASENRLAAAELDLLRVRLAEAEEAVRTALHELGVDDPQWPATPDGVVRAAGPLALLALGEDVPVGPAVPGDDTLAAAVVDLRRRADGRQRRAAERPPVPR